jgi:hypothetical protein
MIRQSSCDVARPAGRIPTAAAPAGGRALAARLTGAPTLRWDLRDARPSVEDHQLPDSARAGPACVPWTAAPIEKSRHLAWGMRHRCHVGTDHCPVPGL